MIEAFEWKEDFVTGNEELDKEHKQLFEQLNELYKMFSDTKQYYDQIPVITKYLEFIMIEHFEIENNLLQKFNISRCEEHMQAHNDLKESFYDIKSCKLPAIIAALLICDIIINYFLKHFPEFDKEFIVELNNKQQFDS